MSRPTPETDAAVKRFFKRTYTGACVCVDADDMRRLERQRDAAVEALKSIADAKPQTWEADMRAVDAMKAARDALISLKRMAEQHPALQGREYINLGIETNNAIDKLDAALKAAQPQAEPVITDAMALSFHRSMSDGDLGRADMEEIKKALRAAFAAQPTPFPDCKYATCDLPGQCKAEGKCHHPKAAQPQEYPSSADDEATRWRHGEPTQPERVSVPREQIEQVQNGIANLITNAETRGDKYDVGYLGAMQKMVDSWLAAAQEGK